MGKGGNTEAITARLFICKLWLCRNNSKLEVYVVAWSVAVQCSHGRDFRGGSTMGALTDNDLKLGYAAVRPYRKPVRDTSHMLKSRLPPNPNNEAV